MIGRRAQGAGRRSAERKSSVTELALKKARTPPLLPTSVVKAMLADLERKHYLEIRECEDAANHALNAESRALFDATYGRHFAMRDLVEPPGWDDEKTGTK